MTREVEEECLVLSNCELFTQVRDQEKDHSNVESILQIENKASIIQHYNALRMSGYLARKPVIPPQRLPVFIK